MSWGEPGIVAQTYTVRITDRRAVLLLELVCPEFLVSPPVICTGLLFAPLPRFLIMVVTLSVYLSVDESHQEDESLSCDSKASTVKMSNAVSWKTFTIPILSPCFHARRCSPRLNYYSTFLLFQREGQKSGGMEETEIGGEFMRNKHGSFYCCCFCCCRSLVHHSATPILYRVAQAQ